MPLTTYTAGEVLTASSLNSNLSYAATAGGLELVKTQTIGTAVSSVQVTDAFSATYDNYIVNISGGVASASSDFSLTFGSTTTGYYWCAYYIGFAGTSNELNGNNTTSIAYVGGGSTTSLNASFEVMSPHLTEQTFVIANSVFPAQTGGGFSRGYVDNTTSYTSFTITPSTGTMTGGTIRVYGYRNS